VRDILVIVVIIAIALVCLGAVNHGVTVDLDYFFGTWSGVSLLWLAAIVAALVIAVGLLAGGSAAVHAAGDRHKLEKELEATYSRLRAAETAPGAAASVAALAPDEASVDVAPAGDEAQADPAPAPADEASPKQDADTTG
jgi:uncharacterized integral membrane protein